MNREEAITMLLDLKDGYLVLIRQYPSLKRIMLTTQAIDMAIEALERERIKCSHCKHYIRHDHRCGWWNHGVSNVDWCSYGKRREE